MTLVSMKTCLMVNGSTCTYMHIMQTPFPKYYRYIAVAIALIVATIASQLAIRFN